MRPILADLFRCCIPFGPVRASRYLSLPGAMICQLGLYERLLGPEVDKYSVLELPGNVWCQTY